MTLRPSQVATSSFAELRAALETADGEPSLALLRALESDARQGVQALGRTFRERRKRARAEERRLDKLLAFENELYAQGRVRIAGVDEAGMAPLAGPVVAAAVILPQGFRLQGLNDSKQILKEEKREALAEAIRSEALAWAVGRAEVEEIDRLNIYHAGLLAMRRAVEGLGLPGPDFCLVDARTIPEIACPQRGIIQGDALSMSIAAASILAKTTRDALLAELDAQFPGYGLASHKGYPTPLHFAKLKELGPCPIHRRSFAPVREALALARGEAAPMQLSLGVDASAVEPAVLQAQGSEQDVALADQRGGGVQHLHR